MAKGGKQPGAGRPKGSVGGNTLKAIEARKYIIERVIKNVDPLINAQLTLAKGLVYLYRIDEIGEGKNKKRETVLVTDPEEIKEAINNMVQGEQGENGYYFITAKDPDNKALEYLISQAIGRPKESVELSGANGGPIEINDKTKKLALVEIDKRIKMLLGK